MNYKIPEGICIFIAIVFIVFSLMLNAKTDKTVEEISAEITKETNVSDLLERDGQFFKKTFEHSADEYDGIVYYSSDDVMNVSEMLIIKLNDSSADISDQLEEYINSRYDIYAAYAPEQGELLKNHILKKKRNVIFMYIGKDEETALDAFNSAF